MEAAKRTLFSGFKEESYHVLGYDPKVVVFAADVGGVEEFSINGRKGLKAYIRGLRARLSGAFRHELTVATLWLACLF